MRPNNILCFLVVQSWLASACLSSTYEIKKDELMRLAAMPPEHKSTAIRVTQGMGDDEPPAPLYGPGFGGGNGVVVAPVLMGGVGGAPVGSYQGTPAPAQPALSTGKRREVGDAKRRSGEKDAALGLLIAGLAAGLSLSLTEGLRFDGWVSTFANHPVRLLRDDGAQNWVPISGLTPEAAAWADSAVITEFDGPVTRGERAPLNRKGFGFELELGAGGVNSIARNRLPWGFAWTIGLGVYPTQTFGVMLGLSAAIGSDGHGTNLIDWRPHLEALFMPIALGRFHAGGYGRFGYSFGGKHYVSPSGQRASLDSWCYALGGLAQIELTTRLALTLRAGANVLPKPGATNVAPELMLGIAVY